MTSNPKFAHAIIRLLAHLIDDGIFWLAFLIAFVSISESPTLTSFIASFLTIVIFIGLPSLLLRGVFYDAFLTSKLGATLGKMAVGIKVTDEDGKLLTYKRSFFRYTTGYAFSGAFFGLGFLNIFTDKKRQAWHDKATPSVVTSTKTLWPLGLVILTILTVVNFALFFSGVGKLVEGPVGKETEKVMESYQMYLQQKEATDEAQPKDLEETTEPATLTI